MKGSRGFKIIFGVFVLVVFVVYSYLRISTSPHSSDFDSDHAVVYSDVQAVLDAGGTMEDYYRSDPRFADILAQQDAANAEAAADAAALQEEPTSVAEPEPTVDPDSAAGRATAKGLPTPPDIDITSWEYVLVNGDNSIGQYEPPELAYLNQTADETDIQLSYNPNRCAVDSRIAQALLDMARGCKEAGYPIFLSSGYRSYTDQDANFQRICANNGITDGKDANGHYITMPAGCSEHQTGLAIDLALRADNIDFIRPEFPYDGVCGRFRALAADYGFVERYQGGKEGVTGIAAEPWHFRYVGRPHARIMCEMGLCLEEYVEYLRAYPYPERLLEVRGEVYEAEVGFAGARDTLGLPDAPYQVSGNNVDGYIYTLWRKPA